MNSFARSWPSVHEQACSGASRGGADCWSDDTSFDTAPLVACIRLVAREGIAIASADEPSIDGELQSRHIRAALAHGVLPHLYLGATEYGVGAVTRPVLDEIRALYRTHVRRTLHLAAHLIDLLSALHDRGVTAMPLKGPVLAAGLYGHVGMRQCTDLDVLVPPQRVPESLRVLEAAGFAVRSESQSSILLSKTRGDGGVDVDLHWSLADEHFSFPLTGQQLWTRATRVMFLNRAVWQPSMSDQLLFLCAHPAKHCWSRLGWLADLHTFVTRYATAIDWREIRELARRTGGERLLHVALMLAADTLSTAVPGDVGAAARRDRVAGVLASDLRRRLLTTKVDPGRLSGSFDFMGAALVHMRLRERLSDRADYLRYVVRTLRGGWTTRPNARDEAALRLPRHLRFLYFVIRPARLLKTYGGWLAAAISGDAGVGSRSPRLR